MEVINKNNYDEDAVFENDNVYQALKLLDFPSTYLPQSSEERDSSAFEKESQRIAEILTIKENSLLVEKDQQLEQLEHQLYIETEQRKHFEEKMKKLTTYITNMYKQVCAFVGSIENLINSDSDQDNILHLGPFKSALDLNHFVIMLNEISIKFQSDHSKLEQMNDLMDKVNLLLKENSSTSVAAQHTNQEVEISSISNVATEQLFTPNTENIESNFTEQQNLPFESQGQISANQIQNISSEVESIPDNQANVEESQSQSILHQRNSKSQDKHSCICGKKFTTSSGLNNHVFLHKYGKVFKCRHCSRSFSVWTAIRRHILVDHGIGYHMQVDKYGCIICGKMFSNFELFDEHKTTAHEQEQNLYANVGQHLAIPDQCHNQSNSVEHNTSPQNLTNQRNDFRRLSVKTENNPKKKHEIDYSQTQPGHFCVCGFKFNKRYLLKSHIKRYTAEKNIECTICGKRFLFYSDMTRHLKHFHHVREIVEDEIHCLLCPGKFQQWKDFQDHLRTTHNMKTKKSKVKGKPNSFGDSVPVVTIEDELLPNSQCKPKPQLLPLGVVSQHVQDHETQPECIFLD